MDLGFNSQELPTHDQKTNHHGKPTLQSAPSPFKPYLVLLMSFTWEILAKSKYQHLRTSYCGTTHVSWETTFIRPACGTMHHTRVVPDDHVTILDPFYRASVFRSRYMFQELGNQSFTLL